MMMKKRSLCKQCLFAWWLSGNSKAVAYCEYQLVTGKKRVNTEKSCSGYIKRENASIMTEQQKRKIYNDLVRKGKAI